MRVLIVNTYVQCALNVIAKETGLEVQRGDLQDLERLAQLRRQHHLLRLALTEMLMEARSTHASAGAQRTIAQATVDGCEAKSAPAGSGWPNSSRR